MLFQKTDTDNLSRKEREKLNRKMAILSSAVPLFAEKGYDDTTIDDIAEKAEFGKGTIYNYFQSKEEIYWAIHEEIFRVLFEVLNKIDNECENFCDFIKMLTKEMVDFCVNSKYAFILIARHRTNLSVQTSNQTDLLYDYHKETDAVIIRRIEAAIQAREIKKIDPQSFIILYRSMIFPYIYNKMFCNKSNDFDVDKESDLIVDILFNGIKKS